MTRYRVFLFPEEGLPFRHLEETAAWFQRFPGPIEVEPVDEAVRLEHEPSGLVSWANLFRNVALIRERHGIARDDFVLLLTKSPNENNWFAAQDEENLRDGFGHVDDFSFATSAPPDVVTAHYVTKSVFNAALGDVGLEWQTIWHERPRGCLFDFCQLKTDLNFKLRTADICGDCLAILREKGIADDLIRQTVALMEAHRKTAINTGQYLAPESIFTRWPFPVAITRHKAVQATSPVLRMLALIDHFDSLVRYCYLVSEAIAERTPSLPERPSLGWWVEQLAHLSDERIRRAVRVVESDQLVHLRNELRAHGFVNIEESTYAAPCERLEMALANIERELRPFLEDYRLVLLRGVALSGGSYTLSGDLLTGSHVLHPPFQKEIPIDPRQLGLTNEGDVYIELPRNAGYRRISPFLRAAVCPECHMQRVLLADGGRRYIDVFIGHRVNLD